MDIFLPIMFLCIFWNLSKNLTEIYNANKSTIWRQTLYNLVFPLGDTTTVFWRWSMIHYAHYAQRMLYEKVSIKVHGPTLKYTIVKLYMASIKTLPGRFPAFLNFTWTKPQSKKVILIISSIYLWRKQSYQPQNRTVRFLS